MISQNVIDAIREQENGSNTVLIAIPNNNQVNDGSAEMLQDSKTVADEMRKLDELTSIITGSTNAMVSGIV